ncbi:conserved hypothetical protein [Neospora caninum Liverpool]|uniref:Magnesium transporter NIPA n=1 Tax=Neospora caninum (strain Liverpool) TaxID=572307 RepID=F0VNU4_NEOCL|nr:conserved hypothetical protein [Neospora caninum Liverpool]CBZ55390.1 conserved hypothetical protein [Neospora caninum Liverpool]|eukprot:XP_003885418.1 conserved hypothetical protein [Neospora caninum Liverpool]
MWQLGIALASVASLSGAVGDALVRLSFVVEEKRLTSHRREANRRQKGGNEEEAEGAKGAIPSEKARVGEAEGARSSRAKKKTIFSLQEPASRSSPDRSRTSSDVFRGSEGRERGGDKRGTVQHAEDRKATHSLNAGSSTGKRPLYLRPLWLIGMCLGTVINSLLSIVSLDFASAAVITPFAGLHIFWNVILSRFVLQERVLLQHYVGSALILLGLLLVLCFGVHTPPPLSLEQLLQLYSQNTCLLYFSASILGIAFCVYVAIVWHEETWGHLCHYKFFTLLFLLGSMAVAQLLFLNVGLARYEALYVVPTTMSVLIVSSCFAEIALFINVLHLPQTEILLFAGGCFSIVVGIMILSGASVERREADRAGAGGGAPVDVEGDDFSAVDASRSLRPTTRHNCTFVLERSPQQFENAFAALEMQADAPGTARRLALSSSPPGPGSSYPLPLGEEAADARGETPEAAGDQTGIACRTRQEGERKQAREGLTAGETERSRTETSRSSPNRRRKGHGYAFLTGEPPLSEEDGREASRQASEMSTRAVSSASLETRSYSESRPEAEGNHVDASPSPFSTRDRKWENPHLLLAVSNTLREYAEHRDAARGVSADEARHADSGFCEEFDFARERRGERGNSAESDSGNSRESESPPSTPDLLEKNLLYRRGRGEKEGESERRLLERTSGTVLASRPARMQEVNICFVDEGDGDATYERRFLTPAGAAEAAHSAAREKAGRDTRNRSNVMEDQNGKLET